MAMERNKTGMAPTKADPKTRRRPASVAGAGVGLAGLEKTLGYQFSTPSLLELALTHRSHPYEARAEADPALTPTVRNGRPMDVQIPRPRETRNTPGTDNEQLEFLGDAVLGLAVTELLFQQFPKQSEGELTRMRASLVSRQRMAGLGAELGLADHLRVGRSAEQNGVRRKPALLANTAEAVLAAIYLDAVASGKDGLAIVRTVVEDKLLRPELAALHAALDNDGGRGALRDAKTVLQERVQAEGVGRLRYADTDQTGPAHQRRFTVEVRIDGPDGSSTVLASAEGSSKKEAQQRAAEQALQGWDRQPPMIAESSNGRLAEPSADRSEDAA